METRVRKSYAVIIATILIQIKVCADGNGDAIAVAITDCKVIAIAVAITVCMVIAVAFIPTVCMVIAVADRRYPCHHSPCHSGIPLGRTQSALATFLFSTYTSA